MPEHFAPSLRERIANSFPSKPRCCEWCDKRGTKANPLERVYIESSCFEDPQNEGMKFWVHSSCAEIMLEDTTITASLRLGGY